MPDQIYFPVYKRLEKEVLELSSSIYFSDDHTTVYSSNIADLILRCSIELESIAKDIYRKETQTEPQNPGACFAWLEQQWKISQKAISFHTPHFHFNDKFPTMLCPFNYKNGSSEDYYSQYNAIKHDRVKNLHKANIYTLIRVLGALFILNLYYYDDKINLNDDRFGNKVDKTKYSEIFSFYIAPCPDVILLDSQKEINPDNCIYQIVRKESYYAFLITYKDFFDEHLSFKIIQSDTDFQEYAKSLLGKRISTNDLIGFLAKRMNISSKDLENHIINQNKVKEIISATSVKMKSSYWCNLNK